MIHAIVANETILQLLLKHKKLNYVGNECIKCRFKCSFSAFGQSTPVDILNGAVLKTYAMHYN